MYFSPFNIYFITSTANNIAVFSVWTGKLREKFHIIRCEMNCLRGRKVDYFVETTDLYK